jgi:DNA-directed RNA polymerase sigma subunit (sigma70/sigma32)
MPLLSAKNRERVARNFIKAYGRARFRRLIEALEVGESGQEIANEFGVSRERVRQWKNTFGQVITLYQLHPEVERILREARTA